MEENTKSTGRRKNRTQAEIIASIEAKILFHEKRLEVLKHQLEEAKKPKAKTFNAGSLMHLAVDKGYTLNELAELINSMPDKK